MFAELAKPVALVVCIRSLYALLYAAFLHPAGDMEQRICNSLLMVALAGAISIASGLIFREAEPGDARLTGTLPVQMFCWAAGVMAVLFLVSWYLETHCVFYRDVRL
ncbi:MAG: hypothetical protein WCF68_04755 [Terriglobales bacterium]